jgi:hypothetical protein
MKPEQHETCCLNISQILLFYAKGFHKNQMFSYICTWLWYEISAASRTKNSMQQGSWFMCENIFKFEVGLVTNLEGYIFWNGDITNISEYSTYPPTNLILGQKKMLLPIWMVILMTDHNCGFKCKGTWHMAQAQFFWFVVWVSGINSTTDTSILSNNYTNEKQILSGRN